MAAYRFGGSVLLSAVKRRAVRNALELKLRRCKGDALQAFLSALMVKIHGDNFIGTGTDYSQGDLKCDGLLYEPLTIFACYGPVNAGAHATEANMKKAVAKVGTDFEGARAKWPGMKEWRFVTNYIETPAQIINKVLELQQANLGRKVNIFGRSQFESAVFGLDEEDIDELLGPDATEEDFRSVQPQEILAVVKAVMAKPSTRTEDDAQPVVVPFEKLEFNGLHDAYQDRISKGFKNAKSVKELVGDNVDPLLEGELAAIYKAKYLELDSQGLEPGEIMDELYEFTLAGERATTPREVAVWSVLAFFFEKCTIFKDKPVTGDPVEEAA